MTEIGEIPEEWEVLAFEEAFNKQKSKQSKIPASKFKNKGKFPIIDQGRGLISGYTDNDELLYNGNLPLIIFGDHTLCVKYVDFQFAVGADGTKLLIPNNQRFSPKFLFYTILEKNLISEGYKRHFSKLRKQFFQCPGINEQRKIAEILSTADETIQKVNEEITLTEKLKKGLMQTLLTKGTGHTKFKMTEIGEIPEEWNVKELYQVSELRKETIEPMKKMSEHYVGLENISSGQLRIFSYGDVTNLKSSKFKFKKGDILYGKLRPYLDKVALAETDGVCSTDIIPILSKNLNARFLAYMLHSDLFLQFVKSTISGTNHPRTAWKQMSHFLLPFPSVSEQQKITEILATVDSKLELLGNKKKHLENLKKGLMGDLLTGKVRVKMNTSKGED
jgi:type I restriction enzyme S subunit